MQDTGSPSDSKTLLAGAAEAQASAPVSSSITASTLTDSAAIEAVPVSAAIVHAQPPTGAALTSASPTAIAKSELTGPIPPQPSFVCPGRPGGLLDLGDVAHGGPPARSLRMLRAVAPG